MIRSTRMWVLPLTVIGGLTTLIAGIALWLTLKDVSRLEELHDTCDFLGTRIADTWVYRRIARFRCGDSIIEVLM